MNKKHVFQNAFSFLSSILNCVPAYEHAEVGHIFGLRRRHQGCYNNLESGIKLIGDEYCSEKYLLTIQWVCPSCHSIQRLPCLKIKLCSHSFSPSYAGTNSSYERHFKSVTFCFFERHRWQNVVPEYCDTWSLNVAATSGRPITNRLLGAQHFRTSFSVKVIYEWPDICNCPSFIVY